MKKDTKQNGIHQSKEKPARTSSTVFEKNEITFNPREKRALRALKVQTLRDFINCDIAEVLNLFYVGKTTYLSLCKKQMLLRSSGNNGKYPIDLERMMEVDMVGVDDPLSQIGLNPREIEAFHFIGVKTIDDFIHCDVDKICDFPGIGMIKLQKIKKYQEVRRKSYADKNRCYLSLQTNISDKNEGVADWSCREQKALQDAAIKTIQDFLLYDITFFRTKTKIGKKTFLGLLEKQKILLEQFGDQLYHEWDVYEVPLSDCEYLTNAEITFLSSAGILSIQNFLYTDLRFLFVKEKKIDNQCYRLIERQKEIRGEMETGLRMQENPLLALWRKTISPQTLRMLPFFSDHYNKGVSISMFHDSFGPYTSLKRLKLPMPILAATQMLGLLTLGELLLVPSCFFKTFDDCNQEVIQEARQVIEVYLFEFRNKCFEPIMSSSEAFALSLIRYLTHTLKKNDRWAQLHIDEKRRDCVLVERANGTTLDEIGRKFNITRERIRQIEYNIWRQLGSSHAHLEAIRNYIEECLENLGGFTQKESLYQLFADVHKWPVQNVRYFLEHLIEIMPDRFKMVDNEYVCFFRYACSECTSFMDSMEKLVHEIEQKGDICSIDKLSLIMRKKMALVCRNCKMPRRGKLLTNALFNWVFDTIPRFKDYRKRKIIRVNSKLGLFESIILALRIAHRPLSKKEILLEVQRLNPELEISEKQIKTTAGNSLQHNREILLWERGGMNSESLYVHMDYVIKTVPILDTIENELLESAKKSQVPQMRLNRIYAKYREECVEQGIPNVYALFACLKCRANPVLLFQRSPYISFNGHNQKLSNARIMENFVRDSGGFVSSDQLKDFGRSLGLRDEHIQNTISLTYLVATKEGFTLCDQFNSETSEFNHLLDNFDMTLSQTDHLSITELYQKYADVCQKLNISDSRMLYHLLKKYEDKRYTLVYPVIALRGENNRRLLRKLAMERVLNWIKDCKGPVYTRQLLDHFVNELGFSQSTIHHVVTSSSVYACGNGMYIHFSHINWTSQKKKAFFKLVYEYWKEQCAAGRPFVVVTELLEKYRKKFPRLTKRFPWNRTLLISILAKSKKVVLWGNNRNIFGFVNQDSTIRSFGDVLRFLLVKHFGDSAPLKDFTQFLSHDLKIIKKDLTSYMIQGYDGLKIVDDRIIAN